MRRLFIFLFLFIISFFANAQTQLDLNISSKQKFISAETRLDSVYNCILIEYKSNPLFISNLKASQEMWLKLRDLELKVMYPEEPEKVYGSVFPMCINLYLANLTNERINHLLIWLNGTEEGDVCAGSIKMK